MIRSLTAVAVVTCLAAGLAGCSGREVSQEERFVSRYFDSVKKGQMDTVLSLYSPLFYEKTPRDQWRESLAQVGQSLGELKSFELQLPLEARQEGPDGSYRSKLVYRVRYSKYRAEETITVFKAPAEGPMSILEHEIRYLEGS